MAQGRTNPTGLEILAQAREGFGARGAEQLEGATGVTGSPSGVRRLRSDESWIEVSSQPSSSSLSSAATDDIIPNGLRVRHDSNARRRRRLNRSTSLPYGRSARSASTTGSSQEEYEESESESDRIMNSSNEGLERHSSQPVSPHAPPSSASDELASNEGGDDDDENSTALGITSNVPAFRPQPNAFSHPPLSNAPRQVRAAEAQSSYYQNRGPIHRPTANSYPSQRPRSHTPYNMISPSHQADHDAALRASLSTLLSCARALPKRDQSARMATSNRIEPSTLRMIPESVVMGTSEELETHRSTARRTSTSSSSALSLHDKGKRKASASKDRREMRKKRRAGGEEMMVAPTLMTWMVSAGVVVLFSAISFSAGYAIGKEVGRMETGVVTGGEGGIVCGKEVGKGLRRLRLGTPTVVGV